LSFQCISALLTAVGFGFAVGVGVAVALTGSDPGIKKGKRKRIISSSFEAIKNCIWQPLPKTVYV